LLTYIKDNNLGNDITYHGQVLGCAKDAILRKSHIFLLPTYYPWEGQPLSIIEAMAYATPIISCKQRGIPEMIDEGINGHFVMPKDPKDIAEKIKAITSSSDKYMNYSEQSRIKYEKDFRREVHLDRLISKISTY
jgi:glycosyltransferase involved in cell wall biosynthesis